MDTLKDTNQDRTERADALLEIAEPDPELLIAAEQQGNISARRRALVVMVADRDSDEMQDTTRILTELLTEAGFQVDGCVTVKSKKSQIRKAIETAVVGGVDLVITVGGTGVGPRDRTPDATREVLDQEVPGVTQALRSSALAAGAVDAMVSRGVSGVSGSTVVVNLAASREAIRDGMAQLPALVHHLVDQLRV